MNAERRPEAARGTAGRRSSSIVFQRPDILGCIRVDLTRPLDGQAFASGEVARRIYRASAGIANGVTLQLVVSPDTPLYDHQVPADARVQVVASDNATLVAWLSALAEGRS